MQITDRAAAEQGEGSSGSSWLCRAPCLVPGGQDFQRKKPQQHPGTAARQAGAVLARRQSLSSTPSAAPGFTGDLGAGFSRPQLVD